MAQIIHIINNIFIFAFHSSIQRYSSIPYFKKNFYLSTLLISITITSLKCK